MARPSLARASSSISDTSSSTQSCIAVKPARDSSPPLEGFQGASSTPPTSVNPTPSIASDQPQSSPKRSAAAVEEAGDASERSTRRRLSKQSMPSTTRKSSSTPAISSEAGVKPASAKAKKSQQSAETASKTTVKGAKYLSLESWLSQSQRVEPTTEAPEAAAKDDKVGSLGQQVGSKHKRHSAGPIPGEPSSKRMKRSTSASGPTTENSKQALTSIAAEKVGAVAARAKTMVTAARRSAREVTAKLASATTGKSEEFGSTSAPSKESRSVRRSTRDANVAPSNEEKAATALHHDSKKMQNKQMISKGKFSTGPADEVMPLPNNWYIGKFGGTCDTYLKDFKTARGFKLGAEVFNPQPSSFVREGKDWSVTKGAKNVFAGNARASWAKSDFANLPQSFCNCKAADACGVDCWNRTMEYECNDNNCVVGAALCKNRPFANLMKRLEKAEAVNNRQKEQERVKSEEEKRRPKYASVAMSFDQGVEVFEATGKGYGVRAQRSFEPDQIIMEYFGEIIDQDEVEKRMSTVYKDSTDFYMMQFHDGFILDATKGSMARFVNHSCEPNCEIRKMLVSTGVGKKTSVEPRMALFAGKNGIQFNEELTYDYNFEQVTFLHRFAVHAANC